MPHSSGDNRRRKVRRVPLYQTDSQGLPAAAIARLSAWYKEHFCQVFRDRRVSVWSDVDSRAPLLQVEEFSGRVRIYVFADIDQESPTDSFILDGRDQGGTGGRFEKRASGDTNGK
jgi:hypothetical protein